MEISSIPSTPSSTPRAPPPGSPSPAPTELYDEEEVELSAREIKYRELAAKIEDYRLWIQKQNKIARAFEEVLKIDIDGAG